MTWRAKTFITAVIGCRHLGAGFRTGARSLDGVGQVCVIPARSRTCLRPESGVAGHQWDAVGQPDREPCGGGGAVARRGPRSRLHVGRVPVALAQAPHRSGARGFTTWHRWRSVSMCRTWCFTSRYGYWGRACRCGCWQPLRPTFWSTPIGGSGHCPDRAPGHSGRRGPSSICGRSPITWWAASWRASSPGRTCTWDGRPRP